MKTKMFTLFFALAASVGTMFADGTKIGDLYYYLNATDQTAEVTSQNSSYPYWSTTITTANIPASVTYSGTTYSVTSIGNYAFFECSSLTSVTIPNSVTSIGKEAFESCRRLTSVTIPNSVTSIGNNAFQYCSGLTSVTIPNSVTSIGNNAFFGVNNIIYSGTATGSPWGAKCVNGYVDGYLVYSDDTKTTLLGCSAAATGKIVIPNSVRSIGDFAFFLCSGLTSVTIPNSVTSIGNNAFQYCNGLTSVTIPNSVTSIGNNAFDYCGLTSVTIPNSVTSIGNKAFRYCTGLTSVTIPNSVTSIGVDAFWGCSSLTSVTIPNSVTSIGDYAFRDCSSLTSVTIGNSVTSIGDWAFFGCSSLTTITNYATTPQTIKSDVFAKVDLSACTLYVLNESIALYKDANVWKGFNSIEPIGAIQTTMEDDEVDIIPEDNSIEITWPAVENAYTYELVIKDKNGNVICTLIFNANVQLTSIAFAAPGRGQRAAQVAGFTFTVTSLNSGSEYSYSIAAKGSQGEVLDTKQGSFTTTGATTTAVDNASVESNLVKVLRNGQIFILRDGKTYTIQGQEVR